MKMNKPRTGVIAGWYFFDCNSMSSLLELNAAKSNLWTFTASLFFTIKETSGHHSVGAAPSFSVSSSHSYITDWLMD